MLQRSLVCALVTVALTTPALAGNITSIVSVGGPGGTGSAEIDQETGDQSVAFASFDFTSNDSITLVAEVDGPGFYSIQFFAAVYGQGVANNTGTTWTSLLVETDQSAAGTGSNDFPYGVLGPNFAYFFGGSVSDGSDVGLGFDVEVPQAGTFSVTVIPNAPAPPNLPEPSSMMLMAIGAAAVFSSRAGRRLLNKRSPRRAAALKDIT